MTFQSTKYETIVLTVKRSLISSTYKNMYFAKTPALFSVYILSMIQDLLYHSDHNINKVCTNRMKREMTFNIDFLLNFQ